MTKMKGIFSRIVLVGGLWFAFVASVAAQSYTFTTIAGVAQAAGTNDGVGASARFYQPSGLALDGAGDLYVADLSNHTIRKVAPVGTNWVVSTLAGLPGTLGSNDGTNDQARFNRPSAVAVDDGGNLFVTDLYNQTIRKLTPVGTNWVVSTVAGLAGAKGSDDGTNSDARFNDPQAVALDGSGKLYVTDRLNCTIRGVTPVGTNWVVSTLAGTPPDLYPGFADGTNGDAEFYWPFGIARHSGGNLYVADFGNYLIRRIAPLGPDWVTTTVAGVPPGDTGPQAGTNDGPGSQAKFNSPNGIAVDSSETLYVTDQFNSTIRKITPSGSTWMVSTVGGLSLAPGTNDGVGATARFYRPSGIALDRAGNLYVVDSGNHTIRKGTPSSVSSPALEILLAANQVVLSWSVTASNYLLETTRALGSGASWAALTNGLAVSGDNYFLTNDVGPGPVFFRLRSQ
jgi:sugar lactone lactonase YvrE